jgi:A/G-specific adenine glycosylase
VTPVDSDFGRNKAPVAAQEYAVAAFRATVWEHHHRQRRDLPWRRTYDPYEILVSEVMLQQTQVTRVLPKYEEFLAHFPDVTSLADAPLADVFTVWSGLGYNRRALSLHRAATIIVSDHREQVPASPEALRALPGIGPATAAAVCVFAFGQPLAFIETNIRSAFIHFFFPGNDPVADSEILPLLESTLDRHDPREWYYGLMDYGAWVKRAHGNPSRRSPHRTEQSPFVGSRRELRAAVLRALLSTHPLPATCGEITEMLRPLHSREDVLVSVVEELAREGFLTSAEGVYRIA